MNEEMQKMAQKIKEQDETIKALHAMANNNAEQAVGGLRAQIASDIKYTVQDFKSGADAEMDDAMKAEFYKSLLEDMFYALRHAGIPA